MKKRFSLLSAFLSLPLFLFSGPGWLGAADALQPADGPVKKPAGRSFLDDLGGLPGLSGLDQGGASELTLTGRLRVEEGGRQGILEVTAKLAPHWHTYAVTQQGGPGPSKIKVTAAGQLELLEPFRPDHAPQRRKVEVFDVPLDEHYDAVVWSAPVRLADGVDPAKLALDVKFDGQICHDNSGCKPMFGQAVPITFGGYYAPGTVVLPPLPEAGATATVSDEYRADRGHVTLRGVLEPAVVPPGGQLRLRVTAVCDPGWHVYAYAPADPQEVAKPTLIALAEPAGWSAGPAQPSASPSVKQLLADDPPVRYHDGTVQWTVEIQVPPAAAPGAHPLSGLIGYQTCTNTSCDPPAAVKFSATVTVADTAATGTTPLALAPARYSAAAELAARAAAGTASARLDLTKLEAQTSEPPRSLGAILLIAFLGGFILNFMPCVLPVIGLKIMSFVQQGGQSRARIFTLNLWYTLGLVAVFLVLATLAVVPRWKLGWGEQFNSDQFNVVMTSVIFVMGLSFLGVWEIPIPGFVGSGKASELAEQEGPTGAFVKGVVTTLLATPCSGPGLATALAWCTNKPAPLVYTVFAVMGLGMASPYLIIGAEPRLVRFLPKPGAWMETFKQIMGFVLLGTVVYMLTFIQWANVVPTLALLFGLWAACWWIGRTPLTEELQVKLRAWVVAGAFVAFIGLVAFGERFQLGERTLYGLRGIMDYRLTEFVDRRVQDRIAEQEQVTEAAAVHQREPSGYELPWEPFSTEKLSVLTAAQKTVLVDFTANWCLTCKFLEHTVLNTKEVRQFVDENGVVTLTADWTDRDPEMGKLLEALGSKQVPVVAIFPAGRPNQPLVLLGGYTQKTLLDKLREAGPSQGVTKPNENRTARSADTDGTLCLLAPPTPGAGRGTTPQK